MHVKEMFVLIIAGIFSIISYAKMNVRAARLKKSPVISYNCRCFPPAAGADEPARSVREGE
jgi:hypothetical protein